MADSADGRGDSSAGASEYPGIEALTDLFRQQSQAARDAFAPFMPDMPQAIPDGADAIEWAETVRRAQDLWIEFQTEQAAKAAVDSSAQALGDPTRWFDLAASWYRRLPLAEPETQRRLWSDSLSLWEGVLGQFGIGEKATCAPSPSPQLPRSDKRFADPRWRERPFFAVVHQTYLMLAEQITAMADKVEGLEPAQKEQLRFATGALVDALSPAHFPLTNPIALDRAMETKGRSLVKGLENLLADLRRGQLSHTDPTAFRLGENIAVTPGQVVFETPLMQLIQYSPTTPKVLATPVVIFPPWINRYYILDLNPKKSFVKWAVDQGLTVFIASWKSADETMAEIVWDDYVRAQIAAIDAVRQRLKVADVHAVGYCVAGTTLAATLAVLARRGEADKVKSATFFTAQVDFEQAGDLKHFVDDQQIAAMAQLSPSGYLDGRYMAATFNLLRGNDLIWNYVIKNYLLGEDYPAFDLLHWNGDTTNLPLEWHQAYLRDLYRDNRMVVPDSLTVDGTAIDLQRVTTPSFVQAGREDHIAPPESVWKITHHFRGPVEFVLAGSGHIAGVVNPPAANKYQYWTNPNSADTLDQFVAGATEHPGSWWPYWAEWLRSQGAEEVPAKGKRDPGKGRDKVIEPAPGRYVRQR